MRDGFIFYRSFYESAKALNDEDRLQLFDAIFEYALNNEETETKPMVNAFINLMKPQIDANNRRYENGKKGGRPPIKKTETKPNNNQSETKPKPKEKEKEKENNIFSFTLKKLSTFENLSLEYKANLNEYINSCSGMSYKDFEESCIMKGYKYKNFKMAYDKWGKSKEVKEPANKKPRFV